MISITQDLKFKQAVVEYSFKHGCMFDKLTKTVHNITIGILTYK